MTQKVIFTREHPLDDTFVSRLEQAGFEVCHVPLIACQPNLMPDNVRDILTKANWVFFTSAVAVESFWPYYNGLSLKIGTIGPQTSLAVKSRGCSIDFEATSHYAVDFVQEWLDEVEDSQIVLLPQSSLSNPVIADELQRAGHTVYAWAMYDTKPNLTGQSCLSNYLDETDVIWAFASPSAWDSFTATIPELPSGHKVAVIGTTTAKSVHKKGVEIDMMPEVSTVAAMVEEIIAKGAN